MQPLLTKLQDRALILGLLLAITGAGGLLRAYQIGDKSLWIDEAFSLWMARQPISEMLSWLVRIDQHPPLSYLLLRAWMHLGDTLRCTATPLSSAAWARALSALAGTLNIPVLYALGRRLFGRTVGLLAALILALSPFHVYLAQETRMYALLCLEVSLAMLALAHLIASPSLRPSRRQSDGATGGSPGLHPNPPPSPFRWRGGGKSPGPHSNPSLSPFRWRDGGKSPGLPPVAIPMAQRGGVRGGPAWAIYILCTAATLWTHNTAILFWAAANLYALGLIWAQRQRPGERVHARYHGTPHPPRLRAWMAAQLGVLLLWSPWLKPFIHQAAGVYREFWVPAPTWGTVTGAIRNMISAFLPSTTLGSILLWSLTVTAVGLGIYRLRKRPAWLALLVTLFFTPIAGELLVSLRRPIFYDRTLIWASIPLYLLFATGAPLTSPSASPHPVSAFSCPAPAESATWRAASKTVITICLLATLNSFSLYNYYAHFDKEQWNDAAAYVARHVRDNDLILYHASWTQLPFDFYFRTDRAVTKHGLPVDLFDRDILEPKMTKGDLSRLYELLRGHDRIWLIYSHNWYTDPQNLIPPALATRARLIDRQQLRGLEVHLYESRTP